MRRIGVWMALTFLATAFGAYAVWQVSGVWQAWHGRWSPQRTGAYLGRAGVPAASSVPGGVHGQEVAPRTGGRDREPESSALGSQFSLQDPGSPRGGESPARDANGRTSDSGQKGVGVSGDALDRTPEGESGPLLNRALQQPDNTVNWLVVGSDSRKGEAARSDALLLVRIQPQTARLFLLSIPRDMRVPVRGYGLTKVNHALAYGGVPLLRETVQTALGVPINHTVQVNFHGFVELIDAVGGVTVHIDKALRYDDATDQTHIALPAGWHHLSGRQALDFVRFRHDALADTGRMQRQQQLLSALAHQHVPLRRWQDVIMAAFHLPGDVTTDASLWDVLGTVAHLARAKHVHVLSRTLQGVNRVDPRDGLWYFYVDPREPEMVRGELALFDHGH